METPNKTLEDHGLRVIGSMTTPTRPGKKPRPVYIIAGKTAGFEETFRDLGGKKFRGQWIFWENPSDSLLTAINRDGRLTFSEQIEAQSERKLDRTERYSGYADNAQTRAETRSLSAHEIGRHIPMGQPILVGHHSERRHRRDIDRIDSHMRKSIEESKKANYFSYRASNLERDAKRVTQDRSYIMNRIEESEAYLARLNRHASAYSDFTTRVAETEEKLAYWRGQLASIENTLKDAGGQVASPDNIKPGFRIKYTGTWYEVVRVSKKTVTIKNWLGVPTFTWKARFVDIDDFRDLKATQANGTDSQKAIPITDEVQTGGAQ